MAKDILSAIQANMPRFSKGQKLIANYILASYDKAAFMTASRLGQTVQVSESTVVRFAAELDYDGYPAMQRALQEMIRGKLTAVQRLEVANDRLGEREVLPMVMQSDIEKIRMTLEETSRAHFEQAVNHILSARRIYILGVRSASAIASFLGFYFHLIFQDVTTVHTVCNSEIFEQIFRIGHGDVMIGISFPRYSSQTVRAMQYASDKGATILSITDSEASPLAAIADCNLLAKSDMASFVDSLVAPLSLVNALIVAVGQRKHGEIAGTFEELERIWDQYDVYEKAKAEDT
ncbi:MAG: MurR/RpiR family transcriptional regulator [Oscillospiraceae bacterium]|nr:MurR/RpiR family transcriptional regulator [Oscillospiraceae bacterium]